MVYYISPHSSYICEWKTWEWRTCDIIMEEVCNFVINVDCQSVLAVLFSRCVFLLALFEILWYIYFTIAQFFADLTVTES